MTPYPVMAVGLDSLLTLLLFIIIAGLSSWLKRKQQPDDTDVGTEPRPGQPPPAAGQPPRSRNWEEELRRLLEGEPSQPPPRPGAPPVITPSTPPRPQPPRRTPARPEAPKPVRPSVQRPMEPRRAFREALPSAMTVVSKVEEAQQQTRKLEQQAQQQLGLAQERIRQEVSATQLPRRGATDRLMARALLRDRHSLRAAIVASVILGPPRALD